MTPEEARALDVAGIKLRAREARIEIEGVAMRAAKVGQRDLAMEFLKGASELLKFESDPAMFVTAELDAATDPILEQCDKFMLSLDVQ